MTSRARTPWFPTYPFAAALYATLPGVSVQAMKKLDQDIGNKMGTAANPVNWSEPDQWIQERLTGESRDLARHIWESSQKAVNPRYPGGPMHLARIYGLLAEVGGKYELTDAGKKFLAGDPQMVRQIDDGEGLVQLLLALSGFEAASRKQLLPEWVEALGGDSRSESTLGGLLYDRLVNLIQRGLVERVGTKKYAVTDAGRTYLQQVQPHEVSQRSKLDEAARTYRAEQRQHLRELLGKMHPYRFEHLIRELLTEMGYEDTLVTQQSGDKGIDVVATAKFGITTVKEVVQVKRVQNTTGRPVIDQLRGALPLHGAIRGTVISLGKFSAEAQQVAVHVGAAPITLIDGETLVDMLIEHEVGVLPRTVPVFDVDESFFSSQPPVSPTDA